nr:hypothetical protein [uncultured Emticicia sp.]
MIDYIKIFAINKHKVDNHIINNEVVELKSYFNYSTGEINCYPKRGKDLNLEINICEKSTTISGSLHKYHNEKAQKGSQNFNDFYFSQIDEQIRDLIKKYQIENSTSITNLEFGFNLAVEKDPQIILDSNILMNNFKAPNKNLKFSGKGDLKEFQMTGYSIKIYNKSKICNLDANILRLELKITLKRFLHQLGIYKLEDLLNKEAYLRLFEALRSKIEGLIIIDEFQSKIMLETDKDKLNKYSNPNYWINLKSTKSPKQIYRLKKDFDTLLKKYQLLKTKAEIQKKLENKLLELLEINETHKVA